MLVRLLLSLTFSLVFFFPVSAATFNVNTTADTFDIFPGNGICFDNSGRCSLRAAISEANAYPGADFIVVPAGIFTIGIPESGGGGSFKITSPMTIQGSGASNTIIRARTSPGIPFSRVFKLSGDSGNSVTINSVTIRNGLPLSGSGGGIETSLPLTLNNCVVRNNELRSGDPVISGAGINAMGIRRLTLNNTIVTANKIVGSAAEEFNGAGIFSDGEVVLFQSQVTNNRIDGTGASVNRGAGIALRTSGNFTATGSQISGNISSSATKSYGAGLSISTSSQCAVNLTNTVVTGNYSVGGMSNWGGGIYMETLPFVVPIGGKIDATFDKVAVTNNAVYNPYALGGGMFAWASSGGEYITLTVKNSTFSNNYSAGSAGGIYAGNWGTRPYSTGTFNFVNSTISGNGAEQDGGGLYFQHGNLAAPFAANMNFVTIANNAANGNNWGYVGGGGGVFVNSALNVNAQNTVIATNFVYGSGFAPDVSGQLNSQSYNHFGTTDGAAIINMSATDSTGNPVLGPLQNNGGPTQTHLPSFGPLIDRIPYGTNGCGTTITQEQRGNARFWQLGCDKGAVELGYIN